MKLKVTWASLLGSALFLVQSQAAVPKSDVPARPDRKVTTEKPKVAPEDEPVVEATTPPENTEGTPAPEPVPESENPYDIIINRNIFRLVAQPPPPPPEQPHVELPNIKISGFSESGGLTTAYFATVPKDPKEPVKYFALSDQVKQEGILELVRIHPGQDEVDVLINGTPTTLSVKSNSFVASAGGPPKGNPGMPPNMPPGMTIPRNIPGAVVPAPGMVQNAGLQSGPSAVIAGSSSGNYQSQSRGASVISAGGAPVNYNNNNYGGNNGGGQVNAGGVSIPIPTRNTRIPPAYPPEQPANPDVQKAMLQLHQAMGGPPAPPGTDQ